MKKNQTTSARITRAGNYVNVLDVRIPTQLMRKSWDETQMCELCDSIKNVGLINPITVKKTKNGLELVAGYRRLTAHKRLNISKIRADVIDVDELQAEIVKMHENTRRENVNIVDEARFLAEVIKKHKLKQKELSRMLGVSEAYVSDRINLNNYEADLIDAIETNKIAFSSARELSRIKDKELQREYVKQAVQGGITPAVAAEWTKEANKGQEDIKFAPEKDNTNEPAREVVYPVYPCALCTEKVDVREMVVVRVCKACADSITQSQKIVPAATAEPPLPR